MQLPTSQAARIVPIQLLILLKSRTSTVEHGCSASQEMFDQHSRLLIHGNDKLSQHLISHLACRYLSELRKQSRLNLGISVEGYMYFWSDCFALQVLHWQTLSPTDKRVRCFGSPVDCIHWVTAAQLTLLEDEMRRIERVNVRFILFFRIFFAMKYTFLGLSSCMTIGVLWSTSLLEDPLEMWALVDVVLWCFR